MSFKLYKSYSFRDKDPIIDKIRTVIEDEKVSYLEIHEASDVAVSTLYNWFMGTTRRPTHAATAAVLGALGYEYAIVKRRGAKVIPIESVRKKRASR